MSFLTQFTGTGAGFPTYSQFVLTSSKTWVAPGDCWVSFFAVGAGGSGAIAAAGSCAYGSGRATGGGAGGTAYKKVFAPAGTTFTITVGAGGAARSGSGAFYTPNYYTGNAGGATSISSSVANVTAFGGGGGIPNNDNGGAGGTATGGDINITGGRGGNIGTPSGPTLYALATGGGAANVLITTGGSSVDTTTRGGDIAVLTYADAVVATGGGGIGGIGGDRTNISTNFRTGGGGSGGSCATNSTTAGVGITDNSVLETSGVVSSVLYNIPNFRITGAGTNAAANLTAEAGGGTGGATTNVGNTVTSGLFGGTGGIATIGFSGTFYAGDAGRGGGGGGATASGLCGGTATVRSGSGGGGIVIVNVYGA